MLGNTALKICNNFAETLTLGQWGCIRSGRWAARPCKEQVSKKFNQSRLYTNFSKINCFRNTDVFKLNISNYLQN